MSYSRMAIDIARESKLCCHHGHGMAVFADGSTMQAISSNDVIARGNGSGGWEYRIGYIDHAMTRTEAAEWLQEVSNA